MKLTKYGHACVVLEEQGQKLVIDPGVYTPDLGDYSNVAGIVITHVHPDHFDPNNISKILAQNPGVQIWGTAEVAEKMPNPPVTAVTDGATGAAGAFSLHFYGKEHAEIHPSFPRNQNIGVLVNDSFYYPGDSFTLPGVAIKTLALPTSGPWLKVGDVIDFIHAVKPQLCFPTHDALLSELGASSMNQWVGTVCEAQGIAFKPLKLGESTEI
jgi:L-ascorbate metabolism protein UlaG (beta-lactamase superfamily)